MLLTDQRCNTCRYYKPKFNQCKVHAPVVVFAAVDENKATTYITTYPQPPLQGEDWCGEWVPTTTAIN